MRHILFVCTGNSCTSQMAQAFLSFYGKNVAEAKSAGLAPKSKIDLEARQVMTEVGIFLPRAPPRVLNQDMLIWADEIITLGCRDTCPRTGKPTTEWFIQDPAGKSLGDYRRVRDNVRKKVRELLNPPE